MHADLAGLGRRPDLTAELDALGDPSLTLASVLAQHRGRWLVATAGRPHAAPARGRLRETPPVTGDWVALDGAGAIAAVLHRHGAIARRAAGTATAEQVLVADVDLALVAEPLPEPNARRAERCVALAAVGGVPAAIVLTKADLDEDAHLAAARLARRLGAVDGFAVSAPHGDGIGPPRALLEPGATAVLLGPSGAGKSTLVNALLGSDRQATGAVREGDGRGRRHDRSRAKLIALPGGALAIDTPGLREVGLWEPASFADVDAARRGLPVRRLRPRGRAGLCRARRGGRRPARVVAQAAARAGVDRRPARGVAGARGARARPLARDARGDVTSGPGEAHRGPRSATGRFCARLRRVDGSRARTVLDEGRDGPALNRASPGRRGALL